MKATTISEVIEAVAKERLDIDQIIALRDMTWEEVCDTLELGNGIYELINEEQAVTIVEAIVEDTLYAKEAARLDQEEINRDLMIANGWAF